MLEIQFLDRDRHTNVEGLNRCMGSLPYRTNVRENQKGNQEWTIHRNWQHWVHKTQDEDKQNKNTTQYVLNTTMRKQTQIT
jgi:hypothetical protein